MAPVQMSVDLLKTTVDTTSSVNHETDEEAVTRTHRNPSWLKSNWKRIVEVAVLSCVILVVWGLFAIPTVFYALTLPQVRQYYPPQPSTANHVCMHLCCMATCCVIFVNHNPHMYRYTCSE